MQNTINPYIAGSPVRNREMYFGRAHIFETVRWCLMETSPSQIVVLHGQRRMGKTSTLYQMTYHLPQTYIPVLVDLQGLSLDGLAELLWDITQVIRRQLRRAAEVSLERADRETWLVDAQNNIQRFFETVGREIGDRHIVFMMDETMLLADKIAAGALDYRVFSVLGALMSSFPYLDFCFSIGSKAGLMKDEIKGFPRKATYVEVGFLEADAARALIQEPAKGLVRYTTEAIEAILKLTAGQPYYTQLICHELFDHAQSTEQTIITAADVEEIRPGVVEMATAQLYYVWDETPSLGQQVLLALAELEDQGQKAVTAGQIGRLLLHHGIMAHNAEIDCELKALYNRNILKGIKRYNFSINLFRYWLLQHQRLGWVDK